MKVKSEECKILDIQKISENGFILSLKTEKFINKFLPGNFIQIKCSEENTILRRPFSVLDENDGILKVYFKSVGKGTNWLANRIISETVNIIAPLGNSYDFDSKKEILLIGGGCGISPLYFLSKFLKEKNNKVDALFGFKDKNEQPTIITENIKKNIDNLWITLDETEENYKGNVSDFLKNLELDKYDGFYCCGPAKMLKSINKYLKGKNSQVSLEARMGCGIGICYGCSIITSKGNKRVCIDGPVFNMNEVIWDEL